MFRKFYIAAAALLGLASAAHCAEPGTTPVPSAVLGLKGCWEGQGEVMGKPVDIAIVAKPIVQDAMFMLDVESSAVADSKDRYSAHLMFGGSDKHPGTAADQIVGYWADSFGGEFAASGFGEGRSDGFDMTYQYPGDAFVNRWRFVKDGIDWQIVARDGKGIEKPFASYSLHRATCRGPAAFR